MIQKIDSNKFSLTILKVTTFSRIRHMQCFSESFTPTEDENEGTFMTAAAIFSELKAKYGASLEAKSLLSFGRCLKNIDGLKRKRTMKGTEYLVIRRK